MTMTNENENKKTTSNNDNVEPEDIVETAADAQPEADAAPETDAEGGAESEAEPTIEELLIKAYEELAESKDKLLRALAETENIRRRSIREKEDAAKYAITNFARDMVPAADNLGRALDALPEGVRDDENFKGLIEGVEMTGRGLASAFEKHGIKEVHPHGEKFDHNLHQAMFEVEDAEAAPGTVLQVMQIGYTIGDRLLRPAMVGVSKAPAKPDE
jgi:molecular chaperone GrpE